uniref:Uncharacterized protein n=1 Tax=Arundo donax TaxID=35708 RepID=A0A0A9BBD6_ARUDO
MNTTQSETLLCFLTCLYLYPLSHSVS